MKLTRELLHSSASRWNGWNRDQLRLLGIYWPPRNGWLKSLVGKEIPDSLWQQVLDLKETSKCQRKRLRKSW